MNSYIHAKKNNINIYYLGILSCLIIFGFYKNGILVYKYSHNIISLFKPLILPLISIIISLLINFIKEKKIEINDNLVYFLIISTIIPVNTNIITFTVVILLFNLFVTFILDKFNIHINYIMICKLIIIGVLILLNRYNYANSMELLHKYNYDLIDIFFGRGISGVASSSILIIIIGYFLLTINSYYKKEIPLISLSIYFGFAIIFKIIFQKVIIFNSLILFSLVFIAPINKFSPGEQKMKMIYSACLGILTFIFSYFINMYDGVSIAILLSSLLNYIYLK